MKSLRDIFATSYFALSESEQQILPRLDCAPVKDEIISAVNKGAGIGEMRAVIAEALRQDTGK